MDSQMSLIVSAPSGSGKTTLLKKIFELYPDKFSFSVSATTRPPREGERHSTDYYFFSQQEFEEKIKENKFLEYEQVYPGLYYGTLKSEIDRINKENKAAVFDVDVKGGINIKNILKDKALSVFIMPPDIMTLKKRLINRGTETEESLHHRLSRAEMEINQSSYFDYVIVNDDLHKATEEFSEIIQQHIFNYAR